MAFRDFILLKFGSLSRTIFFIRTSSECDVRFFFFLFVTLTYLKILLFTGMFVCTDVILNSSHEQNASTTKLHSPSELSKYFVISLICCDRHIFAK